ncbi:MAG: hypothetical protein ACOY94_29050 [Bacillota bacterium]
MRHLLYGLAAAAMMAGALGLGLLPHLTAHWLWFGVIGAVFSAIGAGGWVLAGATRGDWPRPRAGWVLMIGAVAGVLVSAWGGQIWALLWALGLGVAGALLTFRFFPTGGRGAEPKPGPVQAPVSRRQQGR